jgi:hypothetical protein
MTETKTEILEHARVTMSSTKSELVEKFRSLVDFLFENPTFAQKGIDINSQYGLKKLALKFSNSRELSYPKIPETTPDTMVRFILERYWDFDYKKSESAVIMHNYAMGAENIIGNLLERYIANELEPKKWVWCSGSIVKHIDFVYRDGKNWLALQVKNRDNSENSSSKAIRDNTEIVHWFRTFSRKPETNWENFPKNIDKNLSEAGFRDFVKEYLSKIK